MDSTINSTRVPAPAFSGPASNHDTQTSVLNDGATLNLPDDGISLMGGRVLPDGGGAGPTKLTSSRIVRCKKRTIISSLNTRTLGPLGRLEELAESTKRQNIDIVAIQEHRFYHPNDALEYRQAGWPWCRECPAQGQQGQGALTVGFQTTACQPQSHGDHHARAAESIRYRCTHNRL